ITVSATATDAAGNSSQAGSFSFTLDSKIAAPSITLGTDVSGDISKAEATLASGLIQLTAESGSRVTVTFTDEHSHSVVRTVTSTGTASAITLASSELGTGVGQLDDGSIRVSAVATDRAGNTSTAGSFSFTLDTDAPGIPGIDLGNGVMGAVSRNEALQADGVVQVNAENASTVNLTFTDALGHSLTRPFTAGSAASGITLAASDLGTGSNQLSDGTITVSATATDAAGNSSQAGSFSFMFDSQVPGAATVAYSSGVITVTGEQGSTISLTLTDTASHSVIRSIRLNGSPSGKLALTAQDLATLIDGAISVTSTTRDAAGNSSSGTGSFTLDPSDRSVPAPNLHLSSAVEDGATRAEALASVLDVGGNSGHVLTLTLTDSQSHQITRTITADSSASAVSLDASELGTGVGQLSDGIITVTAMAENGSGTIFSGVSNITFHLDTLNPTTPSIRLGSGISGEVSRMEALQAQGVLQITAESGSSVALTFTDQDGDTVMRTVHTTAAASAISLAASELGSGVGRLSDGPISVTAVATDAVGNVSDAGSFSFALDATVPNAPGITLGAGIVGAASRNEALQAEGVLRVNAEDGSQVVVTLTDSLSHRVTRTFTGAGASAIAITLAASELGTGVGQLVNGTIRVSAVASDAVGNSSSLGSFSFTLDTEVLSPSIGLGSGINGEVSRSEALQATGVLQLTAESGSTVVLTFTDPDGDTVMR
ncbi:MAG: hypothetical protein ORN28_03800, partial [Rhodoferax sp.]|nr:hypothetical protein [Rhodoferax sp.]